MTSCFSSWSCCQLVKIWSNWLGKPWQSGFPTFSFLGLIQSGVGVVNGCTSVSRRNQRVSGHRTFCINVESDLKGTFKLKNHQNWCSRGWDIQSRSSFKNCSSITPLVGPSCSAWYMSPCPSSQWTASVSKKYSLQEKSGHHQGCFLKLWRTPSKATKPLENSWLVTFMSGKLITVCKTGGVGLYFVRQRKRETLFTVLCLHFSDFPPVLICQSSQLVRVLAFTVCTIRRPPRVTYLLHCSWDYPLCSVQV